MTFFLDENFPKSASVLLEGMGHRVLDLRGTGREGASDQAIFAEAQLAGAVFLTTDRDFFHTVRHLHPVHAGVIVIALRLPNRTSILDRLTWILQRVPPQDFANRTIQLRDRSWIASPPLASPQPDHDADRSTL
jgi:predicted nuclease of predicted toxin-antitoxin system